MKIPKISIVIPCRNEEKYISLCIHSILDQNYPTDKIEVLVCDGMSDDKTRVELQQISIHHPNIKLLDNIKKTTPYALNLGIQNASGDYVIILGAHAELKHDYLQNCMKTFDENPNVHCVGGVLENVYENQISKVIGMAMSSPFGVGNAHFRTESRDGLVDTVAFGCYKKEVFTKIGLFDTELIRNQDDEFHFRMAKKEMKIYLNRSIRSKYFVRASFNKLSLQYFQYGYWKVFVNRKHNSVTTLRQLIPPLFVLTIIVGSIASCFSKIAFISYLLLIQFYLLASVFFALRKSTRLDDIPGILLAFYTLHFSYGTGYLKGILDFYLLNRNPSSESSKSSR